MLYALFIILALGVSLYLIETYVPMAAPIKIVFHVVVVIFAILLLFKALGMSTGGVLHL